MGLINREQGKNREQRAGSMISDKWTIKEIKMGETENKETEKKLEQDKRK